MTQEEKFLLKIRSRGSPLVNEKSLDDGSIVISWRDQIWSVQQNPPGCLFLLLQIIAIIFIFIFSLANGIYYTAAEFIGWSNMNSFVGTITTILEFLLLAGGVFWGFCIVKRHNAYEKNCMLDYVNRQITLGPDGSLYYTDIEKGTLQKASWRDMSSVEYQTGKDMPIPDYENRLKRNTAAPSEVKRIPPRFVSYVCLIDRFGYKIYTSEGVWSEDQIRPLVVSTVTNIEKMRLLYG